ncbi:uroporphyrinogen-III synthase [Nakamurella endophytica]|uniref:Uroporphyrinogen-III synthase n=1 Tax=Nakamurella endophytica TaxID=1748367 RepID=A0A917SK15_9ACTN|nr:uroporphyrinogen-III synthase [Nakamurella endophytica]GGL84664.1 hypothetical protein GCM10011594_00340 [Nakamurella endophytica]
MGDLAGWRVLLCRPADRTADLAAALRSAGAEPEAVPLIATGPPADPAALDRAARELAAGAYRWVGWTSAVAVDAVTARAAALGLRPWVAPGTRVAAVGAATAARLARASVAVDLVPAGAGSAAALGQAWPPAGPGDSVLLPQSAIAAPDLAVALRDKGYLVRVVDAYRTVTVPPPPPVARRLAEGAYRAVLLHSPSAVAALAGIPVAAGTVVGAVGPSTARAATEAGLAVGFVAAAPTDAALLAGLRAAARPAPENRRTQ